MSARKFTDEDRAEIARRLKLRWANSTKQIMEDFGCSRSYVDAIAKKIHVKQSILLGSQNDTTCEDTQPCHASRLR